MTAPVLAELSVLGDGNFQFNFTNLTGASFWICGLYKRLNSHESRKAVLPRQFTLAWRVSDGFRLRIPAVDR